MRDHQLGWTIPAQPLGEAIKPEKPVKVCEFREFETKVYGAADEIGSRGRGQANTDGAVRNVQPSRSWQEPAEQAQRDAPATSGFKSQAAPPQSKWTPKVGDRVRWVNGEGNWQDCVVTSLKEIESTWWGEARVATFAFVTDKTFGSGGMPIEELEPISTSSDSDGPRAPVAPVGA